MRRPDDPHMVVGSPEGSGAQRAPAARWGSSPSSGGSEVSTEVVGTETDAAHAVPPPVQMVQMLAGFQISQALYVAAKLDLATAVLSGPRSVTDLARAAGADELSVGRLLRTLAA